MDAIWPQLNAYDERELVRFCAQNRIAAALHPDRGGMMIDSDPKEVCRYVHRLAEIFLSTAAGPGCTWKSTTDSRLKTLWR